MISIIDNFDLNKAAPLDSRTVVADSAARLALTWVFEGLLVYQVDTGDLYVYTGTPPSNTAPDWTVTLAAGTPGAAGAVWYNGSGVPGSGLGIVGDYYLDTATGDVYNKTGVATWTLVTNIKGPTGASGTAAGAFGSIAVTGGATAQGLTGTDALITQFTTNGPATGTTPDHTTDKITVSTSGDYVIYFAGDVIGIVNKQYQLTVYVNGVASTVLGTFDCTSNATTPVSFQQAINLPSPSAVIELYGKQISGGTQNLTLVTAVLGVYGLNAKGDQGDPGTALLHTEADIVLSDAKVTAVQAGSWTPVAPWTASVISDSRSSLAVPAAITGSMVGHSIGYDGTNWIDNGVWRGPTGIAGTNGSNANIIVNAGDAGTAATPEEIIVSYLPGSPAYYGVKTRPFTFLNAYGSNPNLSKAQYYCVATGSPIAMTLSNAYMGTVVYVNSMTHGGLITSSGGAFFYKGATLGSLNLTSLGIQSCILVAKDSTSNWAVVAEVNTTSAPVTSVNGLTGNVILSIPSLSAITPASQVRQQSAANYSLVPQGGALASKTFPGSSLTFVSTDYVIPYAHCSYAVQNLNGTDTQATARIEVSTDNVNWGTIQSYTFKVRPGEIYHGSISACDAGAVSGFTRYYRFYIGTFSGGNLTYAPNVNYTIHSILRGGS